jgi:hypothetical protein
MQPTNPKNPGILYVYQKECAISNSKKIVTSTFGPCHVLTGHDPKTKYTFLAHIDDITNVYDISKIFAKLKELGVDLNDLTGIRLLGGYKDKEQSNEWAKKIIEVLKKEGLGAKVDYTYFQKKVEFSSNIPVGDKTHFFGGQLEPEKGSFSFFTKPWMKLELEQQRRDHQFVDQLFAEAKIDPSRLSAEDKAEYASQLAMTKELPLKITVG